MPSRGGVRTDALGLRLKYPFSIGPAPSEWSDAQLGERVPMSPSPLCHCEEGSARGLRGSIIAALLVSLGLAALSASDAVAQGSDLP